jgi:hypothetical protein
MARGVQGKGAVRLNSIRPYVGSGKNYFYYGVLAYVVFGGPLRGLF